MTGIRLTTLLALSASALTQAACGAAEVASPGEGDFGGTGGRTTTPHTLHPGTRAADSSHCFAYVGTVGGGSPRAGPLTQSRNGHTIHSNNQNPH